MPDCDLAAFVVVGSAGTGITDAEDAETGLVRRLAMVRAVRSFVLRPAISNRPR